MMETIGNDDRLIVRQIIVIVTGGLCYYGQINRRMDCFMPVWYG